MPDRRKILLVDDNAKVVADMAAYLTASGYDVETAADGGAAVVKAKAFRPDVVILDVQMPVIDGFEVLNELQKRSIKTRVIMLTGYNMDLEDAVKAVRAGACDYFIKPTPPAFLEERIRRHLLDETSVNLVVARSAANLVRSAEADAEQLRERVAALEDQLREKVAALEAERSKAVVALEEEKARAIAALAVVRQDLARKLGEGSRAEARRDKRTEVVAKVIYVGVSFAAVYGLVALAHVRQDASLLAGMVILVGLLSMERVTRFSSSLFGWKTQIGTDRASPPPQ